MFRGIEAQKTCLQRLSCSLPLYYSACSILSARVIMLVLKPLLIYLFVYWIGIENLSRVRTHAH